MFQVKTKSPMTAAERQRRCRARGKGRHRGIRYTRAMLAEALAKQQAELAAGQQAAESQPAPTPPAASAEAAAMAAFDPVI